ncbi:MAG: amino acid ABC transporter substrate-binding protein [Peptostreptococcaceae bacterium]|nr:amino acid ABC transporter substrate-binding protein [Peptostreptococcaceae bacterium]MDY5738427.1 amino acid ABC transporter substrate-binding protein [Anaerovoracaceae bacterium]
MKFRKAVAVLMTLIMILGIAALTTGCLGKQESTEEKKLVVGLDDTFAPMGYRDEAGDLVGFDIDLAKAVGEELGMKIEFKPINWDAKELELESGNIDCIWNGMSQTPEREKAMELSKKYLDNKIIIMTLSDDVNVEKAADLSKYNIGTQAKSSALEVLTANEEYESFKGKITEYGSYDDAILDLKAGRLDVVVIDQVLGEFKNKNMDGVLKVCKLDLGDDFYVIGFKKGNTDLRNKVNDAIKKLIDNGKAKEISEKWFGKDIVVFK